MGISGNELTDESAMRIFFTSLIAPEYLCGREQIKIDCLTYAPSYTVYSGRLTQYFKLKLRLFKMQVINVFQNETAGNISDSLFLLTMSSIMTFVKKRGIKETS